MHAIRRRSRYRLTDGIQLYNVRVRGMNRKDQATAAVVTDCCVSARTTRWTQYQQAAMMTFLLQSEKMPLTTTELLVSILIVNQRAYAELRQGLGSPTRFRQWQIPVVMVNRETERDALGRRTHDYLLDLVHARSGR